jgi:hypothetical protein
MLSKKRKTEMKRGKVITNERRVGSVNLYCPVIFISYIIAGTPLLSFVVFISSGGFIPSYIMLRSLSRVNFMDNYNQTYKQLISRRRILLE